MKKTLLFSALLLIACAALSQNYWKRFTVGDELPNGRCTDLKVVSNNLLYLATTQGFVKIENDQITVYTTSNSALPSNNILHLSSFGSEIWMSTSAGFSKFDGTSFTNYSLPTSDYVFMEVDKNGFAWFKTNNGIAVFDGANYTLHPEFSAYFIVQTPNGNLFGFENKPVTGAQIAIGYIYDGAALIPINANTADFGQYLFFNNVFATFENGAFIKCSNKFFRITSDGNVQNLGKYEFDNIQGIPADIDGTDSWFMENSQRVITVADRNLIHVSGADTIQFQGVGIADDAPLKLSLSEFDVWILSATALTRVNKSSIATPDLVEMKANELEVVASANGKTFAPKFYGTNLSAFKLLQNRDVNFLDGLNIWMAAHKADLGEVGIYGILNETDFTPGKYNDFEFPLQPAIVKVTKAEIEYHKTHFNAPSYVMPDGIAFWKGNSDATIGEFDGTSLFYDLNQNNIYEPQLGEYPAIYGDVALAWWMNDFVPKTISDVEPSSKTEVFCMLYAFENSPSAAINHSIFMKVSLFNQSNEDYNDLKVGFLSNFSLGNPNDNYIGCDSARSIFYCYNGDNFDEDNLGCNGFGSDIPSFGGKFISHQMNVSRLLLQNNSWLGLPDNISELNQILKGNLKTGAPAKNFLYDGNPITNTGYTMYNQGVVPSYCSSINAVHLGDFHKGTSQTIDLVFGYAFSGDSANHLLGITALMGSLDSAAQFQQQLVLPPQFLSTSIAEVAEENAVQLFPNPTNSSITVLAPDQHLQWIEVFSMDGRCMKAEKVDDSSRYTLDASSFPAGIYVVKLTSVSGEVLVSKFCKSMN